MKKLHEMYASATPKKWRKIGDTCLALAVYGEVHSTTIDPMVGHILVYVGIAGKVISNLATED